ncbi:MAG: alpha-L-fucosidase, partial [Bacilli bacterium]|nr:alpha-L-fucosidase [Bacilli bacterium]
NNFPSYIDFLYKSVELLCTNYGEIGGLWFDGFWDKPNENWEFDRLYKMIRKHQPNAMIINNTGMGDVGTVGHYEIDSVTYERTAPAVLTYNDGKERAGEMCEVFGQHWGYTKNDFDYKPFSTILNSLINCRYNNCNFLLNVGPMGNGYIDARDKVYFKQLGIFIRKNKNFIYKARRADISSPDCAILKDDKYYYAAVNNVPMSFDPNVQLAEGTNKITIPEYKMKQARYLDSGENVMLSKDKHTATIKPYYYGEAYCMRIIKFK